MIKDMLQQQAINNEGLFKPMRYINTLSVGATIGYMLILLALLVILFYLELK